MKHFRSLLFLAVLSAGAAAVIGMVFLPTVAAPGDDDTLTAGERKALERQIANTVRERGMLESASTVNLSCRLEGSSTILSLVKDGAKVKKGDPLVTFDDSRLQEQKSVREIEVAIAEAAVKQAKAVLLGRKQEAAARLSAAQLRIRAAELAKASYVAKDGGFALELKIVQGEIEVAQRQAVSAEDALKINSKDVRARAERTAALTALAVAQARKRLLETHTLKEKTAALDADVASAKAEYLGARNQMAESVSESERGLKTQTAELQQAQRKLARVRRQLQYCRITAPRDGVVMHANVSNRRTPAIIIEEGGQVREGQVLLRMPDFQHLQLRVRVHETQVARVRKGQAVKIRFDALPDTPVSGTVKTIADTAVRGEWPNLDLMLYEVVVTIPKPPKSLRIGMSALAEIDVGKE